MFMGLVQRTDYRCQAIAEPGYALVVRLLRRWPSADARSVLGYK